MGEPCSCPIWGTDARRLPNEGGYSVFRSPRAGGKFLISGSALALLEQDPSILDYASRRATLSQSILEARLNGGCLKIRSDDLLNFQRRFKARGLRENLDLLLRVAALQSSVFGHTFLTIGYGYPIECDFAVAVGHTNSEINDECEDVVRSYLAEAEKAGLVECQVSDEFALSMAGHEYVDSIALSHRDAASIFVAMWFGSNRLNDYYYQCIEPAVKQAGYKCVRIDETHHIDRIDERILAEIRKSKAVVCDASCGLARPEGWSSSEVVGAPRGGVYFEAGFAIGVGVPVIWTVDSQLADVENVIHFDVRQYNQIRWGEPGEEQMEYLRDRILATIGPGPHYNDV